MSDEDEIKPEDIVKALGEEAEVETGEEEEEVVPKPRRRGRPPKKQKIEIPPDVEEALKKIDGATALKLMQFLHASYLSWITEAEAEKYYVTVSRAYSEALQQQQRTIQELTNAFAQQLQSTIAPALESISRSIDAISTRVADLEKMTKPPTIDDRLIVLGAVLLKGLREKLGLPKEVDDILNMVIYESARAYLARSRLRVEEEEKGEESGGEK
jgi:Mg2+ and Co2+ transporter CorA